jgi:hypothetical protein
MSAETRRPLRSLYHVNQYQKNTYYLGFPLNGNASIPVGNIDEDRSNWRDRNTNVLNHTTIDDSVEILNVITNTFELRVSR